MWNLCWKLSCHKVLYQLMFLDTNTKNLHKPVTSGPLGLKLNTERQCVVELASWEWKKGMCCFQIYFLVSQTFIYKKIIQTFDSAFQKMDISIICCRISRCTSHIPLIQPWKRLGIYKVRNLIRLTPISLYMTHYKYLNNWLYIFGHNDDTKGNYVSVCVLVK